VGKGIIHTPVGAQYTQAEFEDDASHYLSSGTSFPASPSEGDLFYRTDLHKWYLYNGSGWTETTAQPLVPVMITMNQQKKDYAGVKQYESPSSEHSCKNTVWHDYGSAVVFDSTLHPDIKTNHKYRVTFSYELKSQNGESSPYYERSNAHVTVGGVEVANSLQYRQSSSYAWCTTGNCYVYGGQTLQCQHMASYYIWSGYTYIRQWRIYIYEDLGFDTITPANQGFTTLKLIQALLNQNDQVRLTKMDDTTVTYTNSAAALLVPPIEGINLPKDILPIQLKKIEQLAGSPMVMIHDGG